MEAKQCALRRVIDLNGHDCANQLRLAIERPMIEVVPMSTRLWNFAKLQPMRSSKGLTLVELVVVVAIMGILASVAGISYSRYINKARMTDVVSELRRIERSIFMRKALTGELPTSLEAIGEGELRDKWGNPYKYLPLQDAKNKGKVRRDRFNNPLNTDFDLYSMGPDGRTQMELNAHFARDDIVRANNGEYVGIASEY
jgi:general secretion pathway protein G